jgi:cytochrome P450
MSRPPVPPAVNGLMLLRHLGDLINLFEKVTREHGPIVRFKNVTYTAWFFNDPEAIEQVLVSKAPSFHKARGIVRLRPLLGNGLLTAEQPEHLPHRRLVQPAFHRKRLHDYARVMVEATLRTIATWGDGATIDVEREMNRTTLEIAAKALFGADLHADVERIKDALDEAMAAFPAMLIPFSEHWDHLPLPLYRDIQRARTVLDDVVYRIIREHRESGDDRGDVLSMLLAARDEDGGGGGFDDEQVRDEALTILLAGHETTANALAWTFYLLQRNPIVEERLHAHVRDVLGDRAPGFDDVADLGYVRAVVAESMRLFPPAYALSRRATKPVEIIGYKLKENDIAFVSQWITQRDPRFWPDPERFDPDRFANGLPEERFTYFPFGGGTRLCIGESFAWTEAILALATIVQRVRLERIDIEDVDMTPRVTLRPASAIRARVRARAPVLA